MVLNKTRSLTLVHAQRTRRQPRAQRDAEHKTPDGQCIGPTQGRLDQRGEYQARAKSVERHTRHRLDVEGQATLQYIATGNYQHNGQNDLDKDAS